MQASLENRRCRARHGRRRHPAAARAAGRTGGAARRPPHRRRRRLGPRPAARPRRRPVGGALVRGRGRDGRRPGHRCRRRTDRRRRRGGARCRRDRARPQEARRHRQQGADRQARHRGSPRAPRRPASRWPSRPPWPAASRSSRRCARASPATACRAIYGILNGTSNYILTTMREGGREFAEVLAEAQKLGYAEADPSFDIDGVDAAHKLAILASVAFGRPVDPDGVYTEGIRHVSRLDIDFAEELGFRIKLLGHRAADRERARTARPPLHGAAGDADRRGRGGVQRGRRRGRFRRPGRARRAAAPAPSRPPRRSPPTSSISPPGGTCAAFGVPAAALSQLPARRWSATRAPTTCG